jgi:hypothetical protein
MIWLCQDRWMTVYRPSRTMTFLVPIVFTGFAAGAVIMIVTMIRGSGPPVWFGIAWLAALGWNAYWWLLRTCTLLVVNDRELRWRTPLRAGTIPLTAVRAVGRSRLGSQFATIQLDGSPSLQVPVHLGFARLTTALKSAAPHIDMSDA